MTPTTGNPLAALEQLVKSDVNDWSHTSTDAWIYGIVVGLDDPVDDPDGEVLQRLAADFGWDADDLARLRRHRQEWQRLALTLAATDGTDCIAANDDGESCIREGTHAMHLDQHGMRYGDRAKS